MPKKLKGFLVFNFTPMNYVDTHIHLYAQEFNTDRDELIREAVDKNVTGFYMPNIDTASISSMYQLEEKYPGICFAMMGLHPCYVKENYKTELKIIEKELSERKFCAIGEIGIDLYWDKTFRQQQEEVFIKQMEWAHELDIPIVIHSRNATDEIISVIKQNIQLAPRGIFHCFSGDLKQAKEIIGLGFYLGIGGVVTFKNSGLDKVIEELGTENIVLETDAPYLAPVPNRGKRNIPSYLTLVADKIAELAKISTNDVSSTTTGNVKKIFGV